MEVTSSMNHTDLFQSILEIDFDFTLSKEFGRLTYRRLGISIA